MELDTEYKTIALCEISSRQALEAFIAADQELARITKLQTEARLRLGEAAGILNEKFHAHELPEHNTVNVQGQEWVIKIGTMGQLTACVQAVRHE